MKWSTLPFGRRALQWLKERQMWDLDSAECPEAHQLLSFPWILKTPANRKCCRVLLQRLISQFLRLTVAELHCQCNSLHLKIWMPSGLVVKSPKRSHLESRVWPRWHWWRQGPLPVPYAHGACGEETIFSSSWFTAMANAGSHDWTRAWPWNEGICAHAKVQHTRWNIKSDVSSKASQSEAWAQRYRQTWQVPRLYGLERSHTCHGSKVRIYMHPWLQEDMQHFPRQIWQNCKYAFTLWHSSSSQVGGCVPTNPWQRNLHIFERNALNRLYRRKKCSLKRRNARSILGALLPFALAVTYSSLPGIKCLNILTCSSRCWSVPRRCPNAPWHLCLGPSFWWCWFQSSGTSTVLPITQIWADR